MVRYPEVSSIWLIRFAISSTRKFESSAGRKGPRSTNMTFNTDRASVAAATAPPGPEPMTQTSKVVARSLSFSVEVKLRAAKTCERSSFVILRIIVSPPALRSAAMRVHLPRMQADRARKVLYSSFGQARIERRPPYVRCSVRRTRMRCAETMSVIASLSPAVRRSLVRADVQYSHRYQSQYGTALQME